MAGLDRRRREKQLSASVFSYRPVWHWLTVLALLVFLDLGHGRPFPQGTQGAKQLEIPRQSPWQLQRLGGSAERQVVSRDTAENGDPRRRERLEGREGPDAPDGIDERTIGKEMPGAEEDQDDEQALAEDVELSAFERQLEEYVDPLVGRPIRQFGYEVFGRLQPLLVDAPVGPDYVLGTGDNLVISLWGSVDQDYRATIDRGGQVLLPLVGPVPLKGLTLARAEQTLKNRFDEQFKNYQLQVRLGRLRDMPVHVVGRVVSPGRVRVSSVATLFDALSAADGISRDGTLRRIELRRRGEEARVIDLYDYLLEGDLTVDMNLAAGDAVVVPAVGARVAVVGRVLRPAIYELDGDKATFDALLHMAGGYARLADRRSLQIESVSGQGLSIRTVDLEKTPPEEVQLGDSEVAVVRSVTPKLENVVYVTGNVSTPGRYALREGMRVSDILTTEVLVKAGFWLERTPPTATAEAGERVFEVPEEEDGEEGVAETPETILQRERGGATEPLARRPDPLVEYPEPFLEYALIRRIDPATKQERRVAFHLGKAVFEKNPAEDRLLQSQDTIVVFPRSAFELPRTVFVSGAVNKPGEQQFYPGMQVLDLVRMAGGLLPEAHLESAVLTRLHPDQAGARFENLPVQLRAALAGVEEANLALQPDDSLSVKVVPEYRKALRVLIEGEVRHPGRYTVIPGERLSDLLKRVGGFTEEAYLPGGQFYRASVRRLQQERLEEALRRLEVESQLAAQRYVAEAQATGEEVQVQAEHARITRLISTIRAIPAKGRLVVRLRPADKLQGTTDDVELADGDRVVVPRLPQEVNVVGAVFNQTALLYQRGMRARDYLQECGGAMDTADMEIAYVIRADGTADSAQSARDDYRWDSSRGRYARGDLLESELYPGDTLVIPHDIKPQLSSLGLARTISQILFQTTVATGVIVAAIL